MGLYDAPLDPTDTGLPYWEATLLRDLGYTLPPKLGEHMPDGSAPTAWNLPPHPFAFLEDTREVIVWEVDGEPGEDGIRQSHLDPVRENEIALRPARYPLPDRFEFVTVTTTDTKQHRIALPRIGA